MVPTLRVGLEASHRLIPAVDPDDQIGIWNLLPRLRDGPRDGAQIGVALQ